MLAVVVVAGCDLRDDSPDEGRVKTDCFTASPEIRPTKAEVESFAEVEVPGTGEGRPTAGCWYCSMPLAARSCG